MAEIDEVRKATCDFRAARGAKITYHETDPGTTGANLIATTPASATTVWPGAVIAGNGAYAESVGAQVVLNVPPGKTVGWVGVWNGTQFIRGYPLDGGGITIGAAAVPVAVTPRCRYAGNT